jgi:glycosyltransferase involved in cell wall biosynthesis
MIKLLFYTENNWAFGAIHRALCKHLFNYGIYADILSWENHYTDNELSHLVNSHDFFATSPESLGALSKRGIPLEKIIIIAHGSESLNRAVERFGVDIFNHIYKYAVINPQLSELSKNINIKRLPEVVKVGIDTTYFCATPSKELKDLGYAGAKQHILKNGKDCKRVHLIEKVAKRVNLPLVCPATKMPHACMPGYYKTITSLMIASSEETAGLPAMEAAASGKLVLSTKVGYFDEGYGIVLNMNEENFISDAVHALEKYKDPKLYSEACDKAQQYSIEHHDWTHHIEGWVNLFN